MEEALCSPPARARGPSHSSGGFDAPSCGHDSGSASAGIKTALRLVFARGDCLPAALVDEAFDSSRDEWGQEQHDLRAVMEALFAIAPEVSHQVVVFFVSRHDQNAAGSKSRSLPAPPTAPN